MRETPGSECGKRRLGDSVPAGGSVSIEEGQEGLGGPRLRLPGALRPLRPFPRVIHEAFPIAGLWLVWSFVLETCSASVAPLFSFVCHEKNHSGTSVAEFCDGF